MTTLFMEGCSPNSEMAFQYFEKINSPIEEIKLKDDSLQQILFQFLEDEEGGKIDSDTIFKNEILLFAALDKKVEEMKISLQKNKLIIENIELFNEENVIKKSAINFLETYQSTLKNEISKITSLLKKPYENFTENDEIELNSLLEKYNENLDKSLEIYHLNAQEFSMKYNLQISVEE